ncbi:PREDICTED: methyltransferase-like protein 9 [Diuraphis noxia]|uniref:methyltransferase-like protein 9 n=1 Tax=Diuraphis noxia TaxID=143948 RepID=UPI0007635E62|nr:PREDICTED: methyltransferase-like protein 9 [Diuraphis noxia]
MDQLLNCFIQAVGDVEVFPSFTEVLAVNDNWYSVDKSKLDNEVFLNFVQMHADAETERFLNDSIEQSDRLLAQVWKSMVSSVLNVFMTKTSINGRIGSRPKSNNTGPDVKK